MQVVLCLLLILAQQHVGSQALAVSFLPSVPVLGNAEQSRARSGLRLAERAVLETHRAPIGFSVMGNGITEHHRK